jgi:SAM-dependent methyltransferase
MHDSAYRIGELVMQTYCDLPNARILEVGSMNVNGSLRDVAEPTTHYVGLDLEEGDGVDVVIKPGERLPFDDDSFDLIMASSAFEHDPRFWETFVEMCRVARPGGHIYVNAPSNGLVHRFPLDCWRFYPDAGLALADHARNQGMSIELVESFIGKRINDCWNDFAAIFRKGPDERPLNLDFVYKRYPSNNARTWNSTDLDLEHMFPEDMQMRGELQQQLAEHVDKLEGTSNEIEQLTNEIEQLTKAQAETERLKEKLASELRISESETAHLRSAAADLERQVQILSAALQAETDASTRAQEQADWLRAIDGALACRPFFWSILPFRFRRTREYELLRRAGLFDNVSYLARYPDVAAEGADPLRHYITYGMNEGRDRGSIEGRL